MAYEERKEIFNCSCDRNPVPGNREEFPVKAHNLMRLQLLMLVIFGSVWWQLLVRTIILYNKHLEKTRCPAFWLGILEEHIVLPGCHRDLVWGNKNPFGRTVLPSTTDIHSNQFGGPLGIFLLQALDNIRNVCHAISLRVPGSIAQLRHNSQREDHNQSHQ